MEFNVSYLLSLELGSAIILSLFLTPRLKHTLFSFLL